MVHIGSIFSTEFRKNPFFIVKKGCTDAGCGWRRLCSRVGAASSFFFFSRRIGPNRSVSAETAKSGCTGAETDVAERGADGGGGLPGAEPSVDLQLSLPSFLVGNEIEIQVQVLEISDKLATWAFHLDNLSVHLNL